MKTRWSLKVSLLILSLALASTATAQTGMCLSLGTDLYSGDKNESVRFLQNFLAARGYLTATPNGVYGPATTAAVRALQTANKISATGNVGPATRAAIEKFGCATLPAVPPTSQPASVISSLPTSTPTPVAVKPNLSISSPQDGEILTIGKNYTINWNGAVNYLYDIVLDKSDGSSGGFVTHNAMGGNSFSWRSGSRLTSTGEETMATGTYRVRIQSATGVSSSNDPVSGWFTLNGVPLAVNSINPTSVPRDARASVAVLGSGFDSSTRVHIDQDYGLLMNVLYISPDGTVLVFNVPSGTPIGMHALFLNNTATAPTIVGNLFVTN